MKAMQMPSVCCSISTCVTESYLVESDASCLIVSKLESVFLFFFFLSFPPYSLSLQSSHVVAALQIVVRYKWIIFTGLCGNICTLPAWHSPAPCRRVSLASQILGKILIGFTLPWAHRGNGFSSRPVLRTDFQVWQP